MVQPMTRVWPLAVLLSGCSLFGTKPPKPPPIPNPIPQVPLPPIHDVSLLPVVQGAQRLLIESGAARLEIDPSAKDAITALGECADAVTYCYAPGVRDLADCLGRTRSCATDTPWGEAACCPLDCKNAFGAEVGAGSPQLDAFEKVFFLQPDCFPGVRAALEAP